MSAQGGVGGGRILNGFGFGFRVPVAGFDDQVNLKCVLGGSLPGEGVSALGGVCPVGVSVQGVYTPPHCLLGYKPPCEQNDRQV